jgi:hypothetical protein
LRVTTGERGRRPLTRLATAGAAGHVFFELAAGVGMPFASFLGPGPAAGLWSGYTAGVWRTAANRPSSADRALAVVNAISFAAVIAHFLAWPRRTRFGLPWLEDCEGLGPELMPIYNPILHLSGAAALGALLAENRTASRRLPLLVVAATVPVLVRAQHGEFRRLQQRAQRTPGRWNRRLRPRTT